MTDAIVTQAAAEAAIASDAPVAKVTHVGVELALIGDPSLLASGLSAEVGTASDNPNTQVSGASAQALASSLAPVTLVSGVTAQVLVSWRVKQGFLAIWVD